MYNLPRAISAISLALAAASAQSAIIISEVAPWSSGNSTVAADWFELTNTGASAVDITGWKIDDNSNSFATAVALRGVTSIGAGQSVVFFEGIADATTDAAITARFNVVWGSSFTFGGNIGAYGGSGVGFGTGTLGDAVNVYDSTGTLQANVTFGASPSSPPFSTFDNAAGLNNAPITQLSLVGVNGAFGVTEIGSPGTIAAVPEPSAYALMAAGLALLAGVARRRSR